MITSKFKENLKTLLYEVGVKSMIWNTEDLTVVVRLDY